MGAKTASAMNNINSKNDESFKRDFEESFKMNNKAIVKAIVEERLAMRSETFQYAKLGIYMCFILNGLAITTVLNLITKKGDYNLSIYLLKYSLICFVAGIIFSMLLILFSNLSQKSFMSASDGILLEYYKKYKKRGQFLAQEEHREIYRRHNKKGDLLNITAYVAGIFSVISFIIGSLIIIKAL